MRFSTLLALVASTSAASTMDLKTMALRDQMKSLQTMVKVAETHKAQDMISAISDRKSELEYQLALNNKDKDSVARELQYLLSLVQTVESNDHAQAAKVLNNRKNKLMKYQMHLQDAEEPAAEEPAAEEPAAEEPAAEEPAAEEPAAEEPASEEPATEEPAAEEEAATDDAATTDPADPAVEEPKKGKMVGGIIGGVVVAGLLVGGCVYMRKKNSDDNEGGDSEDKKLFKLQFKGNTLRKVQKESLVPTFAIPAEENI